MPKGSGLAITILILGLAVIVPWQLGYVTSDQIIYLANMVAGWAAWTCFVAVIYAGLEKLFPDFLGGRHSDT